MATLQGVMLDLARVLIDVREAAATGGSATTLTDVMEQPAGYFTLGTLFFKTGALAGYSAPVINHSGSTSAVLTFVNPHTGEAVSAGDLYAALPPIFLRGELMGAINDALRELGPYVQLASAGTIAADTYEYNISPPPGLGTGELLQVEYKPAGDLVWRLHQNWREAVEKLIFDFGFLPAAGTLFRMWWLAEHVDLSLDTAVLSRYVNPAWLRWAAVEYAARRRFTRVKAQDPDIVMLINEAKQKLQEQQAIRNTPRALVQKTPRLSGW